MIGGRYESESLPKFGKVPASAADEVVKKIPPQRDLPFTLMNFTPSVASGDSSLKREPWQDSELKPTTWLLP